MTTPSSAAAAARPTDERCAFTAQRRGDHLMGTAPTASGFFLIEQPGGWGRLALEQSELDHEVGITIARACGRAGLRPLLIRRPGRRDEPAARRWFRVDSRFEGSSIRSGTFADDAELLTVVNDAQAGELHPEPIYAVCTHGRHDPCCAIRGRPVAAAFAALAPELTWECSHVGGDRFAGNVVVFPWGLYYGWVDPADAPALMSVTADHRLLPHLLRGRACFPPPVQAAQQLARTALHIDDIDSLAPLAVEGTPPHWVITLDHAGSPVRVRLEREAGPEAATLTCGAQTPVRPPHWRLVDLER